MIIKCIWEHNGNDTLLYAEDFSGAFTRGASKEIALSKMPNEIISFFRWQGKIPDKILIPEIVYEKNSILNIADADTDIIFNNEKLPLSLTEYYSMKETALQSAECFLNLYNSIPDKNISCIPARKTFYGEIPRTAFEMYEHTKNVNEYYFGEIGIHCDKNGTILDSRIKGFDLIENTTDFLCNSVHFGSCNEQWSLKKVMRRFIWHDRIHAKAMYRMAVNLFGKDLVLNTFQF